MLQNAYFLAKIGADTAENERNSAENLPKFGNYPPGPWRRGPLVEKLKTSLDKTRLDLREALDEKATMSAGQNY